MESLLTLDDMDARVYAVKNGLLAARNEFEVFLLLY